MTHHKPVTHLSRCLHGTRADWGEAKGQGLLLRYPWGLDTHRVRQSRKSTRGAGTFSYS